MMKFNTMIGGLREINYLKLAFVRGVMGFTESFKRRYSEDGIRGVLSRSIPYTYAKLLRPWLPTRKINVTYNSVESEVAVGVLDEYIPGYSRPWYCRDMPNYERTSADVIREYVSDGDDVVVVGAGFGVTPVVAARQVGTGGSVIGYEGSCRAFKLACRTVEINNVQGTTQIKHAIVGEAMDLRGDAKNARVIGPRELPSADVLELDCEGAEKMILRDYPHSPRVLIVETHAMHGAPRDLVEGILENRGYDITTRVAGLSDEIWNLVAIKR